MPNAKKIISFAVILLTVALAIYYIQKNYHEFSSISLENPYFMIPIILILVINYFLTGLQNNELLKPFGVLMSRIESFQLSIVTGFYNLITPFRGGMAARAVYLKKKYGFAYVNFLATLSAFYVIVFLIGSFAGIAATLWIYFKTSNFSWILFVIFAGVFLSMSVIVVFSPQISETKNLWINRFIKVINGWHLIRKKRRVILSTSVVTIVQLAISSLMLVLQFHVFGISITFSQALFLSAIGSLAILISITPAGLGISEAVIVFSATTIGITPAQSLSAALLGRAVSLVALFILGQIFSYKLLKRKTSNS